MGRILHRDEEAADPPYVPRPVPSTPNPGLSEKAPPVVEAPANRPDTSSDERRGGRVRGGSVTTPEPVPEVKQLSVAPAAKDTVPDGPQTVKGGIGTGAAPYRQMLKLGQTWLLLSEVESVTWFWASQTGAVLVEFRIRVAMRSGAKWDQTYPAEQARVVMKGIVEALGGDFD